MLAGVVTIGNPFPRHGGFDAVVKNIIQWAQETPASTGREMVDDFRLRGSSRCRQKRVHLSDGGVDI